MSSTKSGHTMKIQGVGVCQVYKSWMHKKSSKNILL
jgi:hypothetical protein